MDRMVRRERKRRQHSSGKRELPAAGEGESSGWAACRVHTISLRRLHTASSPPPTYYVYFPTREKRRQSVNIVTSLQPQPCFVAPGYVRRPTWSIKRCPVFAVSAMTAVVVDERVLERGWEEKGSMRESRSALPLCLFLPRGKKGPKRWERRSARRHCRLRGLG